MGWFNHQLDKNMHLSYHSIGLSYSPSINQPESLRSRPWPMTCRKNPGKWRVISKRHLLEHGVHVQVPAISFLGMYISDVWKTKIQKVLGKANLKRYQTYMFRVLFTLLLGLFSSWIQRQPWLLDDLRSSCFVFDTGRLSQCHFW